MKIQLSRWIERQGSAAERAEPEIECLLVLGAVIQRRGEHYWIARDFEALEEASGAAGHATH
jgi:hypothetical protein